jgi:hypothetical protein
LRILFRRRLDTPREQQHDEARVFRPAVVPQIDLVMAIGPKRGTAKVFVFDIVTGVQEKVVKFNLRAERSHYKAVRRITGLQKDRLYVVAVVSANGKPVMVDAFKSFLPETPTSPPEEPPSTPPEGAAPHDPGGALSHSAGKPAECTKEGRPTEAALPFVLTPASVIRTIDRVRHQP